jgi:REP element-mobilizing transposase RayT
VEHRARPAHGAAHPLHVTLRSVLRSLRHAFVFPTVRGAIQSLRESRSDGFRVVEFSVQGNHVHLILEAADAKALRSGIQALAIRIALRVNRLLMRRGKVWADRYHARALTSPRAVRRALVYVLANFKKHTHGAGAPLDPCSSAPDFDGFRDPPSKGNPTRRATSPPRTWLLRHGWRRHGLIGVGEVPAPESEPLGMRARTSHKRSLRSG